jgi:two-component system response regulator HydG
LIDDDAAFRRILGGELEKHGHWVACLECAEGGPDVLDTGEFDLVLLDNQLSGGTTGLEFLGDLRQRGIRLPVVLMTGYGSAKTAIEAVERGAFAYVIKRVDIQELLLELQPLIARALEIGWRSERVRMPGDSAPEDDSGAELLGISRPMIEVYRRIGLCAGSEVPVLIRGETGTGKELVARAIRARGPRKDRPFVVINCAAFSEERLDDELFGHEPGTVPGHDKLRKGSFEHADGGTLFLDEVGNLPLRVQEELLGALGNHEVFRRGSSEPIKVNVRLLAATRHDLEAAMREGKFLRELFVRLNGMPIDLPPLRERGPEDLRLLAEHYLARMARSTDRPLPALHEGAWAKLRGYTWPGNIWELQNVIGRAALLCRGPQITAADIEFDERPAGEDEVLGSFRRAIGAALQSGETNLVSRLHDLLKQELLLLTLTKCGGDADKAERLLGVPLSDLLPQNPGRTDGKREARPRFRLQTEALLLIHNHPEWAVKQYADKLETSPATLWRDPIINKALKARGGGR